MRQDTNALRKDIVNLDSIQLVAFEKQNPIAPHVMADAYITCLIECYECLIVVISSPTAIVLTEEVSPD